MKGHEIKEAQIIDLVGSPTSEVWFLALDNGEKVPIESSYGLRHLIGVYGTAGNIIGQQIEYETNNLGVLHRFGVDTHPAVMVSFSLPENVQGLRKRLKAIDRSFEDMEIEELVLWGDVEERLRKARIGYRNASHPKDIPPEQV